MLDNSLISVIIPVYNPGKHLYKCIDSIVNQTYKNLEIILIDDGSSDGSGEVCDKYAEKDSRIKVIHQENAGVSRARNVGIDLATGDYYHFPDSDDYIDLDTYEFCLDLMKKNNCDAVVFEYYSTFPSRETSHIIKNEYYGLYDSKEEIVKINFRTAFAWNKFFSKKLIKNTGNKFQLKFREDIFRGEDGIFSRLALHNANRVWFTNKPLYHYVQSEESACRGVFRPSQLTLIKTLEINKEYYSKYFPKYLARVDVSSMESYIMLYYDMYIDKKDYCAEQEDLHKRFQTIYKNYNKMVLSTKQKIKFAIFDFSPKMFCKLHSINEKSY